MMCNLRGAKVVYFVLLLVGSSLISLVSSQVTPQVSVKSTGSISYDGHRLRTLETSIVDGAGNKIVLAGTQMDRNEYSRGYFSIEDLQKIKSYGGNCIEIHILRFALLMPQRNTIDEAYFINNLDKWVSWCEQMQIYYIVNLRNFKGVSYEYGMPEWMLSGHGYGSPPYSVETVNKAHVDFLDIDNPLHNDNRESFILLWKFIANRYKNNQYALFGIMNEPLCGITLTAEQGAHLGVTYSKFMEQVVDAIRSVGAKQLIFVDRPYVTGVPQYFQNVQPVNRDNIVWEDHIYVTRSTNLTKWKTYVDLYVKRYINDFHKPLFIGEFGIDPYDLLKEEPWKSNWKSILLEQVTYLKTSPICGRQWHQWGALEGEYYDYVYNWFTAEDSKYILETIFG